MTSRQGRCAGCGQPITRDRDTQRWEDSEGGRQCNPHADQPRKHHPDE